MNFNNWEFDIVPTIFICIFFPLFLYFSYWLFISGCIGLYRMIRSKSWKSTVGKIVGAEIKFMNFSSSGDSSFKFIIEKEYQYTIHQKEYISKQNLASDSLYAKEFKSMDKFPEKYELYTSLIDYKRSSDELKRSLGTSVKVFYDDRNPEKSCLIPGINKEIFIPILMGLLACCGITYLTFHFLKPLFQ